MVSLIGYAVIMGRSLSVKRCRIGAQLRKSACIEPGKPTQNAYIEGFNGTFRREVLDAHNFQSIRQVRQVVDEWLVEYNMERPHQALQFMMPVEYR